MELELAIASTDIAAARAFAGSLGGTLYADERDLAELPFRALATVVTDDLDAAARVADVGLHLVCRRLVKAGVPEVVGVFPLVRRSDRTHRRADEHWRDVHAPLALKHHAFMTHYTQLSVIHTFAGSAWDGFALCGFASLDDLRERFFSEPDSREVITADIRRFADVKRSPRRLIARETRFGQGPAATRPQSSSSTGNENAIR